MNTPGKIVLLGSGETSLVGGRVFAKLVQNLSAPPVISVLETPAGFELNSKKVAEKVGSFLQVRLQNERPKIHIIPARKKETQFSPDNREILEPLLESNVLFMGAGSPTYAVRQLQGSLAWDLMRARHARGASMVLASAAIVAAGKHALPVYEIFKVGEDPHWVTGLDLLGAYGLSLVFVPHWNNQEGGADLDTSRCYLGQERFNPLLEQLPTDVKVVGLDELTAVTIDFSTRTCEVFGHGSLHLVEGLREEDFSNGMKFPLSRLGEFKAFDGKLPGFSEALWSEVMERERSTGLARPRPIPQDVKRLISERELARESKDWARADEMRKEIERAGWQVNDTPAGPLLVSIESDY